MVSSAKNNLAVDDINEAAPTKRVLILSSSPDFNQKLIDHISELGYHLIVEPKAQQAIQMLGSVQVDFVVLHMDQMKGPGFALFKKLVKELKLGVGVVTTQYSNHAASTLLHWGAKFYARLPISRTHLGVLLKKHLPAAELLTTTPPPAEKPVLRVVATIDKKTREFVKKLMGRFQDPEVRNLLARKAMEAQQLEKFVHAYEACIEQTERMWVDAELYELMGKLSDYYEGASLCLLTYSKENGEVRRILDTSKNVDKEMGDLIEDEKVIVSVNRIAEGNNAIPLEAFSDEQNHYAVLPLIDHTRFSAFLLLTHNQKPASTADLVLEINRCFNLGVSLKNAMVGKYSLVEVYKKYFIRGSRLEP